MLANCLNTVSTSLVTNRHTLLTQALQTDRHILTGR